MAFISEKTKEINCKVIYYGPPQSGKSTTLRAVCEKVHGKAKGDLVSLNQGDDRTLYFDFVPLNLGKVRGYTIRLHLYTVPGEIGYKTARALTSKGLDGVVFVADSQLEKMEANLASLKGLREVLLQEGHDLDRVPLVFQYNKRDLPRAVSVKELSSVLNMNGHDEFESVATTGDGVFDVLKAIGTKVILSLQKEKN